MTIDTGSFANPYAPLRPMLTLGYKSFSASITVRHWQLRDLVSVSANSKDEILYPHDKIIYSLNLSKERTKVVTEFEFEPRCIQTYNDVVAVGALQENGRTQSRNNTRGLFAVYNRQTEQNVSQDIGECINNSINLYSDDPVSDTSQVKAIVCNNDFNLYFVDIDNSGIKVAGKTKFEVPLNHASISPDRKTIIACGDTKQLYVCHPEDGNSSSSTVNKTAWTTTNVLDSWCSYGFSTAFHSSGLIFGAAFETGIAHLYDMRNLSQPLTKIYSTRPGPVHGAFRCLKFSQGLEDIVFVSEQTNRVHAIDLRDFDNHQVLMVPKTLSTGEGLQAIGTPASKEGQYTPCSRESDPDMIKQYRDMINTGYATEFSNDNDNLSNFNSSWYLDSESPHRRSHLSSSPRNPPLTLSPTSNSNRASSRTNSEEVPDESPFAEDEEEIPEIPSYSVFRGTSRRFRRSSNTGSEWESDFISSGEPTDAIRQELISPLRDLSGIHTMPTPGPHTRSRSFGAMATTQAAARRTFLLEQQLSDEYSGARGSARSSTNSLRSSPAPASSQPMSPGITRSRRDSTPAERWSATRSHLTNPGNPGDGAEQDYQHGSAATATSNTSTSTSRRQSVHLNSLVATNNFISTFSNVTSFLPSMAADNVYNNPARLTYNSNNWSIASRTIRQAGMNDSGISGISWMDHEGGSLVVGLERGIGVWKIDLLASRMFLSYEQR